MNFPKVMRLKQRFDDRHIEDISSEVRNQLAGLDLKEKVKKGDSIAISAGSRGIADIDVITRAVVEVLKGLGGKPFIFPAMGSHGGATAEGQKAVLRNYGITEETMGVPIKSSMEVVQVGKTEDGLPVYLDKFASQADHIVIVNRVKSHPSYAGEGLASGLYKMMTIGIGKHKGAIAYHEAILKHGFARVVLTVGEVVLEKCPLLFGLGIVENAYDRTARIEAMRAEEMLRVERKLQKLAEELTPKLPFDYMDFLIVDEMGKEINGAGMDCNVIERGMKTGKPDWLNPKILWIFVRDLTAASEGNAVGIGFADFTTRRLVDKIDYQAMYVNTLTGRAPWCSRIPLTYDSDKEVLEAAFPYIPFINKPEDIKMVWIKNTLHLDELEVSEAFLDEVEERNELELVEKPRDMQFDTQGNLISPFK